MIKKISLSLILFCLFVASFLALAGVERVSIGEPFLGLIKQTNMDLESFKIAIPDVPLIPSLKDVSGFWVVLDAIITFFNGIISLLNISIQVFNVIIKVIQFIVLMIKNIVQFISALSTQ